MKILLNENDLNEALFGASNLGFVPTMGSLHKGHISLIKKSKKKCSKTIVSIFVNPTQFSNRKDYKNYPKNEKKDLLILKKLKVNFVYLPKVRDIYKSKRKLKIKLRKKEKILCAKFRKGHFEGVIDVMNKLTNIINPNKIFMGEKDFQQLYLTRKYIKKKYKKKIIACKTIRNINNLALSSRLNLLKKKSLKVAEKISQDLIFLKKKLKNKKDISKILENKKKILTQLYDVNFDYLELRNELNLKKTNKLKNSRIFFAFNIGGIRLIDNL